LNTAVLINIVRTKHPAYLTRSKNPKNLMRSSMLGFHFVLNLKRSGFQGFAVGLAEKACLKKKDQKWVSCAVLWHSYIIGTFGTFPNILLLIIFYLVQVGLMLSSVNVSEIWVLKYTSFGKNETRWTVDELNNYFVFTPDTRRLSWWNIPTTWQCTVPLSVLSEFS